MATEGEKNLERFTAEKGNMIVGGKVTAAEVCKQWLADLEKLKDASPETIEYLLTGEWPEDDGTRRS